PFVDAWADFVLRGDAGRAGLARDVFLRRCVSGWNTSGAVGLWCRYGSSGFPPRDVAPPQGDVAAALAAPRPLWRPSLWGAEAFARFDAPYYPRLERIVSSELQMLRSAPTH